MSSGPPPVQLVGDRVMSLWINGSMLEIEAWPTMPMFELRTTCRSSPAAKLGKRMAYMRDEHLLPAHDRLMVAIDLSNISFS